MLPSRLACYSVFIPLLGQYLDPLSCQCVSPLSGRCVIYVQISALVFFQVSVLPFHFSVLFTFLVLKQSLRGPNFQQKFGFLGRGMKFGVEVLHIMLVYKIDGSNSL